MTRHGSVGHQTDSCKLDNNRGVHICCVGLTNCSAPLLHYHPKYAANRCIWKTTSFHKTISSLLFPFTLHSTQEDEKALVSAVLDYRIIALRHSCITTLSTQRVIAIRKQLPVVATKRSLSSHRLTLHSTQEDEKALVSTHPSVFYDRLIQALLKLLLIFKTNVGAAPSRNCGKRHDDRLKMGSGIVVCGGGGGGFLLDSSSKQRATYCHDL